MLVGDADWLSEVYSTLDDACSCARELPQSAFTQMACFIDDMRFSNPASDLLAVAQSTSIAMHRLQTAVATNAASSAVIHARTSLKKACDEWIRACPLDSMAR